VISPLAIAVQGIGFAPNVLAVQGFAGFASVEATTTRFGSGGADRDPRSWTDFPHDDAFDIALGLILSGALE
jgi:hypothetical protein